jgi:hypothetical protein
MSPADIRRMVARALASGGVVADRRSKKVPTRYPAERRKGKIMVWSAESSWLPRECVERLDALGKVRGFSWREMPSVADSEDVRAMNFWLWCRGLLDQPNVKLTIAQRARRDAMLAMAADEKEVLP